MTSDVQPKRTAYLLTWPAAEEAAIQHQSNPMAALDDALARGLIKEVRRKPQKDSHEFAKNPQEGVACILVQRYYDEPLGLILPLDVVEKMMISS